MRKTSREGIMEVGENPEKEEHNPWLHDRCP